MTEHTHKQMSLNNNSVGDNIFHWIYLSFSKDIHRQNSYNETTS